MKLVPETNYKIVNDDGSDVRPATAQKVKDIVQLMKDSKILGDGSPVPNTVAMKIASAILTHYELRKKRQSTKQETLAKSTEEEFQYETAIGPPEVDPSEPVRLPEFQPSEPTTSERTSDTEGRSSFSV